MAHVVVALVSLLMIPGLAAVMQPIDIEAYNIDSPEIEAQEVARDEFASGDTMIGFMIVLREQDLIGSPPGVEYVDEVHSFTGVGAGIDQPTGGILNLTVLREMERKVAAAEQDPLAPYYRPLISDVTLTQVEGVLSLPRIFIDFMSNKSILTRSTVDVYGRLQPARTNWYDCGELECLQYNDTNLTQAHIDLAAARMANNTDGIFLRWLSHDRAFLPDPDGVAIGPVGGTLTDEDGFVGADWQRGRWSAGATWLLIQLADEAMELDGWTFDWVDARAEDAYEWDGFSLRTVPPARDAEFCYESMVGGEGPCAAEWSIISLEYHMRESDEQTVTFAVAEGLNVEVNRELKESVGLIITMVLAIVILLWASLRRWSDVGIVSISLGLCLLWMHGLIGWGMIFGNAIGHPFIERSQFSNLLPILILALGIDDSLHVLHRYKEERRAGRSPDSAANVALTRVGRAIMLTSLTTMVAFGANLTSDIPALRSFGTEAAFGVGSAFVLTGLWAPLVRLDFDLWQERRGKLEEEVLERVHLVPSHWLAKVAGASALRSLPVLLVAILITAYATPKMLALEGDFKIEDFFDDRSDFATVVHVVNDRFPTEGEPAMVLIEGDMLDPRVYAAIEELRSNMNIIDADDPDRFTRRPDGTVELSGVDHGVLALMAAMATDIEPFEAVGWNSMLPGNGVDCDNTRLGLPDVKDRDCLEFLFGFLVTYGIPETQSTPPVPPSIPRLYIQPTTPISMSNPSLAADGGEPRYERMLLHFGLRQPEQFSAVERALDALYRDMAPLRNLSTTDVRERGDIQSAFEDEDHPVTWAIATGEPVARFVAAHSMQKEMQGTLMLGVVFCVFTLWWGFRPTREEDEETPGSSEEFSRRMLLQVVAALLTFVLLKPFFGSDVAVWPALLVFILGSFWGLRSLGVALLTTGPILVVVIWLYGLISGLGYGLNMVTVAIATLSLGVGIDYVIHVVERFREERHHGRAVYPSLVAVGGASGLALVGSAASDVLGFLVISLSPMGFFSLFGMFSAAMIFFSLIASMVIATALIGLLNKDELQADLQAAGGTWQQMQHLAEEEVSQAIAANGYSGESSAVDDGEE